jgi:hypothetical protein
LAPREREKTDDARREERGVRSFENTRSVIVIVTLPFVTTFVVDVVVTEDHRWW